MKILIATGLYPPESGGPATFAKLAETKLGPDGLGHMITVIPFRWVRKYPKLIRHVVYFLMLWKRSKNQDVVLALDPISVGLPARFLAKVKRLPFVVRLGGDYAWEQGKQRFGITCNLDDFPVLTKLPLGLRILKFLQTYVTRSADRVIAPSEYLKSVIVSWGVEPEKVTVIYSVSNLGNDLAADISPNELVSKHSPVLLSIARLVPWKGFEVLIEVVAELKKQYSNILLVIAGDGPFESVIRQKIKDTNTEDSVHLLGRITHAEIRALQTQVDMFVLNTEYEGFPHVVMENMFMHVPVITTNVGGNPELIVDGKTGLLVPYNDQVALRKAIEKMLENDSFRTTIITEAKAHLQNFTIDRSVTRVVGVLNSVVQKGQ